MKRTTVEKVERPGSGGEIGSPGRSVVNNYKEGEVAEPLPDVERLERPWFSRCGCQMTREERGEPLQIFLQA